MNGRRPPERVLIVDGYNVINARRHITGAQQLADARDRLVAELQNYAGYSGQRVIVVFDAWQADREVRSVERFGAVEVVFTQKGEIADHYIERLCDEYRQAVEYRQMELRVATSDALEQTIVLGRGAVRISARELLGEMEQLAGASRTEMPRRRSRMTVEDRISPEVLERMRRMAGDDAGGK